MSNLLIGKQVGEIEAKVQTILELCLEDRRLRSGALTPASVGGAGDCDAESDTAALTSTRPTSLHLASVSESDTAPGAEPIPVDRGRETCDAHQAERPLPIGRRASPVKKRVTLQQ